MSDRALWLTDPCPECRAPAGVACRALWARRGRAGRLHVARGWRWRPCRRCGAPAGEPCRTPSGTRRPAPHAPRRSPARHELVVRDQIWKALAYRGATIAHVAFSGGGGRPGQIGTTTLERDGRVLERWETDADPLIDALRAPVWDRYGLFRGHPRITGHLCWAVPRRTITITGRRGHESFEETIEPGTVEARR